MKEVTKNKKVIGIDARFYGPLGKGLGRYVQEVVDNLIKINEINEGEFKYIIFLSPENFEKFETDSLFVEKRLISLPWYSWREQLFFPRIIKKEKIDLMHFPHFNVPIFSRVPFVVTIHDLILTRFPSRRASMLPSSIYWLKQFAYRVVIKTALRKARRIISVSNFTKQDILNKFTIEPSKLIVTYEGVPNLRGDKSRELSDREEMSILRKYKIKKPFILYVGNAYPHKNLEFLLGSFVSLLADYPKLKLLMVGREDYFYKRLKKQAQKMLLYNYSKDKSTVLFPGYIPDSELAVIYKKSLLYVFPSLYEGFGLPPLEAMLFSCPVLSSNQASLPEILGEAASYFDPYNQDDFLSKIRILIDKDDLRESLKAKGLKHIKNFSWSDCAYKTLDVYRQALKS